MIRNQLTGRLLASVLALACAGALQAEQKTEQPTADEASVGSAGMRVFKDPVTGEFREPTAAEAKALNSAVIPGKKASKSAALATEKPLRSMMTASGAVGMEVPESAYNYLVVTRGADGKLHQACSQGEDAASHAAHTATVAQETVYETQ